MYCHMTKITSIIVLLAALLLWGACDSNNEMTEEKEITTIVLPPQEVTKSNQMKVYAHYMPWFETPSTNNGKWGQHWTMANCNPDRKDATGKSEIASHYYPLIGPYASSDATVLDYHALLMKYSGIDGVMIDWYGLQDKYDYSLNKRNTEALVEAMDRAGLEYAIVYEDATLNDLDNEMKISQARIDMLYLQRNFFNRDNYIKTDDKPLLMIFGPQQILNPKDWTAVFNVMSAKPAFVVLNGFTSKANDANNKNSSGEFLWVNSNPDYSNIQNYGIYIGGAMPGFYDYYKEGNWGDGYTTYNAENGALFKRQLKAAMDANLKYLQISTWNDFGEGTNIEPAQEYGYQYLNIMQDFTGVSYKENILKEIYRWYELKVKYNNNDKISKYLTQAYYYFISLQPESAINTMNEITF